MIYINKGHSDEDQNKVVVTGLGVVSSVGIGKDAFWESLKDGRSGIKPVTLFDTSTTRSKLAGEISDFKPEEILGPKGLRNLDRTTTLALSAAKLALKDANFEITEENTNDVGVVLGSTMGSVWSISEFDKEALRNGFKAVNPAAFPNTVINSPASQISIKFKIKGFNTTISSGFTSSLDAMEYAKNFILLKRASAVLVGGVEELCEQLFKGFYKLGFLSGSRNDQTEVSAPFDDRRNGAVVGEGSAMFLIERKDAAEKRHAHIYGCLEGSGFSFDRKSIYKYNLKGDGAKRAISQAFFIAKIAPEKIDCVSASANSTLDGDVAESRLLMSSLSTRRDKIIVSATKSIIGETFSASGAFQLAASFLMLENNIIHPTINVENQDKRCLIDCVPNKSREMHIQNILVTSVSPMGQNSAMIVSKDDL